MEKLCFKQGFSFYTLFNEVGNLRKEFGMDDILKEWKEKMKNNEADREIVLEKLHQLRSKDEMSMEDHGLEAALELFLSEMRWLSDTIDNIEGYLKICR